MPPVLALVLSLLAVAVPLSARAAEDITLRCDYDTVRPIGQEAYQDIDDTISQGEKTNYYRLRPDENEVDHFMQGATGAALRSEDGTYRWIARAGDLVADFSLDPDLRIVQQNTSGYARRGRCSVVDGFPEQDLAACVIDAAPPGIMPGRHLIEASREVRAVLTLTRGFVEYANAHSVSIYSDVWLWQIGDAEFGIYWDEGNLYQIKRYGGVYHGTCRRS